MPVSKMYLESTDSCVSLNFQRERLSGRKKEGDKGKERERERNNSTEISYEILT